ncbi:HNH endonuclease signature motif containing protein [Sulfurospirillum halorespirans]|uniref:Putative HNH endonuclease n=1 Tax=Sulfurospirillum halorespirans DSM 13726 TaxID=1193502 RepID=A0A1D7TGW2_9BACT|nr:HNH endonuclease signature motif containing protein [Sulfurospirillum halorespirans]AOO64226.1 putative HNH endonuclease [Sulfurospirillum halorespirans DSM 13726]
MRKAIPDNIQRKLYAESMGRCMNPSCEKELLLTNGDIAEKAHITPHSDTADNSFENLILLCPNCHTNFDKNSAFTENEVRMWKEERRKQLSQIFAQKFNTFEKLEEAVKPILEENKTIYENYYLKGNPKLWKKFEEKILLNNQRLKLLLSRNRNLFQKHDEEIYSNLATIDQLVQHIDEFYDTREDNEKIRTVLFPEEVNSIFGLEPCHEGMIPSVEALECLIGSLQKDNKFIEITLGIEDPFIVYKERDNFVLLSLSDTPRIRQMYFVHKCFKKVGIRLDSLNFALKYLDNNHISFTIENLENLSNVIVKEKPFKFIYEYCLSKEKLISLAPQKGLIIVNLHNWNSGGCISTEAYQQAEIMDVTLLTLDNFYRYVHNL